jgi:membrane protein DedA with SNARE-associated domain
MFTEYLNSFLHFISGGPSLLSATGFMVGAFIEELIAPLPLPILLIGSTFFFKAKFSLFIFGKVLLFVALPISIGATIGSIVIFFIAYEGGKPAIIHFKKYVRVSWMDVEKFQKKLDEYHSDRFLLFISRAVPFLPTTVATIIAGLIRMNPWVYIYITFVGIFIRVVGLLLVIDIVGQAVFAKFFNL